MPEPQKYKLTAKQKRMLSDYHQRQHAAAQPVEPSISAIDSVVSLYNALNGRDEIKPKALLMLMLRNWLTEVSSFDPVSGHALHTGIVDFMDFVAKSMQDESSENEIKDRIYRIVSHTKEAVLAIMEHTRDKILREHAMLPIHAAREVDSNSVQWLSRQPGRTLREKLSGKPYIMAVRRRPCVDTAENRLLKAFLFRLEQILIKRQDALAVTTEETCEELLVALQRWLRSEDAAEIGAWGNLPPNNTLLQDKRYRKVWDGWLWLQGIDEHIIRDSTRFHRDILSVIYWNTLSLLNHTGRFRTVQQPVGLDYDNFSISPELPARGYLFPENLSTPPTQIAFKLLNEQIDISVDEEIISILIDIDQIVLDQKNKGTKKNLKIEPAALKEIPKTILSLVMYSLFEYSEPPNNQSAQIRMDSSVVDLCSIRPTFTNNTGSQAHLPFRLLQQIWTLKDGMKQVVDCGSAKAITLSEGIESISMRRIFSHSSTLPDAIKSSASMFFTKKLSDYITADKLTYLVPDWGNDFDLEGIRKSVNFYFDESTPLPKSIAAIFAWQSSADFEGVELNNKSEILVVDSFYGGFSVTPITVQFSKKLNDTLLQTKGVAWERHPTFLIENNKILKEVVDKLGVAKCPFPEDVIQLFGLDGLFQDAGNLTLEKDAKPFHIPYNIIDVLQVKGNLISSDNTNELRYYLNEKDVENTFILPLSQSVILDSLLEKYKRLAVKEGVSLTEGALTLEKWQKDIDDLDIALWRDHLPKLSIKVQSDKGYNVNFYLVKDATVTPQRGRTVNIPVEELFNLPAGRTHYSFTLQQGEGNKELQFVAYLKSPAFPLKEATACRLKMTYTYGADDPYELKFIPLDSAEAGFKSIRVDWRSASEGEAADLENLPVPDFPARKSWSDFQKFPKEDGKSFSDLLGWVKQKLDTLNRLEEVELKKEIVRESRKLGKKIELLSEQIEQFEKRDCGQFVFGKYDINGYYFCIVDVNGERVFCHSSNFTEPFDENRFYEGAELYLNVVNGRNNKLAGQNVSLNSFLPESLQGKIDQLQEKINSINKKRSSQDIRKIIIDRNSENVRKAIFSLRFPVLTIWNHGHSLSESDVPDHFRNAIFEGTQKIISIIESENMPDTLKEELLFFLCCLHKDAPGIVGTRLLDYVKDKQLLRKYHRNISFAIGNAEMPWQRELLKEVLLLSKNADEKLFSRGLKILGTCFWRSEDLIYEINLNDFNQISKKLYESIKIKIDNDELINKYKQLKPSVILRFELLLALLRSRGNEDEGFKTILAPDKDLTKEYVTLVDDVSKIVIDGDIKLKSRISLQIEKPDLFRNTPDLLYALWMYLTGDSGANTVVITGVSD